MRLVEWCRLLKAGGLYTVHCAHYFFAHCYQTWPRKWRRFSGDPLPHRVFLKDRQSMKECSGAGSHTVCPEQVPPATKSQAQWLCDHCAQEGPKSAKERPETPSQGRREASPWFWAPDWLQNTINRNSLELWLLCLFFRKGCKLPCRNCTNSLPHHTTVNWSKMPLKEIKLP